MIDTAGTLQGRRPDGRSTRAPRACSPPPRTRSSPATRARTSPPPTSRRSSSPTRSRCAPARRTTSRVLSVRRPADRLDPPDLHRRLGVARSSAARTSCSERADAACQDLLGPRRGGAAARARRRPARAAVAASSTTGPSCRSCSTCWPRPRSTPARRCCAAGCARRAGRPAARRAAGARLRRLRGPARDARRARLRAARRLSAGIRATRPGPGASRPATPVR